MSRWMVWLPLGVANVVVGGAYFAQRPTDHEHLCRTHGINLDLSAPAKLANWVGTQYLKRTGKHMTSLNINEWVTADELNAEVDILTRLWAPHSPIAGADASALHNQERNFHAQMGKLFDHPQCIFSPMGRVIQQASMRSYLTNRRNIIRYARDHPQLLEGAGVDDKNGLLMVVGMHRSGTSLLQNLLGLDPRSRTPRFWEMMNTVPPAENEEQVENDKRVEQINRDLERTNSICRGWWLNFCRMHKVAAEHPEEDCIILFAKLVHWYYFHVMSDLNPKILDLADQRIAYTLRFLHLFLKIENYTYTPSSHWVLKNPDHSRYLEKIFQEFPQANVVITHRDPKRTVPSWATLLLFSLHMQIYNDAAHDNLKQLAAMTDPRVFATRAMDMLREEAMGILRARQTLEKENPEAAKHIFDVNYSDLVRDPEAVIRKIYDHFGYEFTEEYRQRLHEYLEMDTHKTRKPLSFSAESYHISGSEIDEQFQPYLQKYSKFF